MVCLGVVMPFINAVGAWMSWHHLGCACPFDLTPTQVVSCRGVVSYVRCLLTMSTTQCCDLDSADQAFRSRRRHSSFYFVSPTVMPCSSWWSIVGSCLDLLPVGGYSRQATVSDVSQSDLPCFPLRVCWCVLFFLFSLVFSLLCSYM